jgi:hypothetical protein
MCEKNQLQQLNNALCLVLKKQGILKGEVSLYH